MFGVAPNYSPIELQWLSIFFEITKNRQRCWNTYQVII
jgi:hypothetical protein